MQGVAFLFDYVDSPPYFLLTMSLFWQEYQNRFWRLPDSQAVYGPSDNTLTQADIVHGTVVAALAGGKTGGIARKAEIVFTPILHNIEEKNLEALVKVAEAAARIPINTCLVNMSWGRQESDVISNLYFVIMIKLMQAMETQYGCIFVVAPGNDGQALSAYPAKALQHLKGMFVVGAVDSEGKRYSGNSGTNLITAYAAGVKIPFFGMEHTGTSFATPQVAGLAAYFRAHPSWTQGKDPRSIFDGIQKLSRHIQYANFPFSEVPIIWNGQTANQCAPIKRGLEGRQSGEDVSCPFPGSGSGPGKPQDPQGPRVEFRSGEPGPLCTAPNCGKLCSGFYCVPNPTGTPPDFSVPPSITAAPTFTPPPGEWCLSETTIRQCNGGPRDAVCSTTTECVSWGRPDLPTPTPDTPFSPSGGSCISSTTWTSMGGPKFEATIIGSSCAEWSTPAPPTPTPTPEPPAPPRCFTGHLMIATEPLGEDAYPLQIWDNGNRVTCHGKRVVNGISDNTVLEYDCDGGGYVAITEHGGNFKEYRASDGWTIKPDVKDYQKDTQKVGTLTQSLWEATYTGGDCSKCPTAELCDYRSYCPDFEGACNS